MIPLAHIAPYLQGEGETSRETLSQLRESPALAQGFGFSVRLASLDSNLELTPQANSLLSSFLNNTYRSVLKKKK
jgi:hypothetical protein